MLFCVICGGCRVFPMKILSCSVSPMAAKAEVLAFGQVRVVVAPNEKDLVIRLAKVGGHFESCSEVQAALACVIAEQQAGVRDALIAA